MVVRTLTCSLFLQVSMRRGTARSWDHAQLVHEQWFQLAVLGTQVHVVRVGTHDNVADLPSRLDFKLLRSKGASEVAPSTKKEDESPATWEVLKERWQLSSSRVCCRNSQCVPTLLPPWRARQDRKHSCEHVLRAKCLVTSVTRRQLCASNGGI